jgi:hypothetical protein
MYKILNSQSVPGLVEIVNAQLVDGFVLVGGPFESNGYFYQAVNKQDVKVDKSQLVATAIPVQNNKPTQGYGGYGKTKR